ncbi:MAG: 4-(cytidine 5'-diphospho)-2-C-methyl-D-erythritol kinase, partial [Firmicutes bacterium]|nr:4-(cytidine 5'-diphospho)-2-C-methyl-D-erythritol kinase [Bacillota bacterium]
MEPASERGTLSFKARAKINLCLGVLAKRPDGYHEIESVMQSVGLSDEVSLRARRRGVRVACRWDGELTEWSNILGELPPGRGNLAYKAARLVLGQVDAQERSKLGAFISITKRIPVAAGLAGGSTDAASVLVGLNRLWSLGLGTSFLSSLGTRIGADLPFCLQGGTAVARGIGEKIEPLPAG